MIIPNTAEKIKAWGRGSQGFRVLAILAVVFYGGAMFMLGTAIKSPSTASSQGLQVMYDPTLDSSLEYLKTGQEKSVSKGSGTGSAGVSGSAQGTFSTDAAFVASSGGTKYYPIGCGSVSRIKEENRVYFVTEDEAKTTGYDRTTACK